MHADGARREYEHLSRFVPPPCSVCQRSFPAGTSHDCSYPTTQMPHDIAAARFAAQGAAKQLAAELEELKRTSK
jgi:hypothetical protein